MITIFKDWLTHTVDKQHSRFLLTSLLSLVVFTHIQLSYADTQTRASAFEYDPVSGLLTKEIIEPDNSNLCLVTTYTYDTFGNKTSSTTRNCNGSAGSNPGTNSEAAAPAATITDPSNTAQTIPNPAIIEARTSSATYDATGRFGISSKNALNQTETKTTNANFGTIATLTGPNQLNTSWTYDSFGRPVSENRADGTSTQTSYALCDTNCTPVGLATVKYIITTTQAGVPYRRTYHDMNGRVIQTETTDVNSSVILTQTQYDKLGRTIATSQPFKAGTSPVWTTVNYDKFDRPTRVVAPDGTVTTTAYNGYTTTTTNAKSQTKTEVKNSQGQLVRVTDTQNQSITYQYDPFGNLVRTTDALNNITTINYDKRGRKTAMDDPDQGVWSYQYDALGQLKKQTDAKSQNVTFNYDKLGRMTQRDEPDLVSTWAYDTCDANLNPAGKCVGKVVKESSSTNYIRTYLYDAYGRETAELDNVDTSYGVTKSYDSYGRVATLVYPGSNGVSFSTRNVYSSSGLLMEVREVTYGLNKLLWQAGVTDNAGRLKQFTYGNNVTTTNNYDPLTGRIVQIQSGTSNSVSNQSFVYDTLGNLTQRYDAVTGLNESFGYDSLNRLTSTSAQAGTGPLTQTTLTYNAIGNILTKSDIGTYTYASLKANGTARAHAVSKIVMNDGVTVYGEYTYDANGNQLTGAGRTMTWNSWNMPVQVTGTGKNTPTGTTSSSFGFVYNASHERVKETLPDGTVIYNISPRVDTGIHTEKRVKPDGQIQYSYALYAGGVPFGTHIAVKYPDSITTYNRYYHTDHLGSIIAVSDDGGLVVERRSYDAWGKRRNSNGTSMNNAFVTPEVRHAFTGHEDLGEVGLIHMNGRLYDPATGRFLSADPTIQYPDDMQNYNRYSYINNNPLAAVDYSGYGWNPFKSIKKAFKKIGKAIKSVLRNKVVRLVATVVAAYYGGVWAGDLFTAASTSFSTLAGTAYTVAQGAAIGAGAGFAGGFVASGGNIKAALTGAVAGAVAGVVTGYYGSEYPVSRVFANGAASGVSAKIQGRDFMDGLRSGLITSAFTYGNTLMRKSMIESSLNPISEGRNDGTGFSMGMFGDMFKLAGGRSNPFVDLDAPCSPLGCNQKGPGEIAGWGYPVGSFRDMVLESFAGPHDAANSSYFYDYEGSIKYMGDLSDFQIRVLEYSTNYTSSLAFATPFAAGAIREQSYYSSYRYVKRRP